MTEVVDYKKEVKALKKKVDKFKSLVKTDRQAAFKMARELQSEIAKMLVLKEVKEDKKTVKNLKMVQSALDVYISTMEKILGFKKQYDIDLTEGIKKKPKAKKKKSGQE